MRGTVVFDGDCGYCRGWVRKWRDRTGGAVRYVPFQELDGPYLGVSRDEFRRKVWFFPERGEPMSGMGAVLSLLRSGKEGEGVLLRMYRRLPWFRKLSEFAYGLVARHRMFFSRMLKP